MIQVNPKLVILGILIICLFYYLVGNMIHDFIIFKKRKKDYSFDLILLIAFGLLGGSIFIFSYIDFFTTWFCLLYPLGFVIIVLAMILHRENIREDRIYNLVYVLDRVKRSAGFDIKDLIIPNKSFTAKMILKYGPKKTARIGLIVVIGLSIMFLYLAPAYISNVDIKFYIYWIIWLSISLLWGYKRTVKEYKSAFRRAEKGSYKKDSQLF